MALNAQLYAKLASNQPQSVLVSSTCIISGDGSSSPPAFIVIDPTAIRRLDITAETKTGTLTNGLTSMTVLSTLAEGFGTVTNGGSGYTAGTHTGVVVTSGGINTARATVVVSAAGVVTSVAITDGGDQYALSSTGVAACTLSGGTPGIGGGSNAAVTVALTTGTGTGTITAQGWVAGNACKAARLLPAALANLGTNFPTAETGFRVSLQESSGKTCIAQAYAAQAPAGANMTWTRVSAGVYKVAFPASRISGSLPPHVQVNVSLSTGQGPGVSAGSYASSVFANIGLDGKAAGGLTFGVEADPLYMDPANGDIYVYCVDHNNVPRDPYPGSRLSVSVLFRNSSAVV